MAPPASVPGYSTRQVARMLGLPERRVRSWVRAGFLVPRRGRRNEYRFSFQDLVILRAAQGLVAERVPARRVKSALVRLAGELPRGRSLAAVALTSVGGRVVVRESGEAWEPESGQRVFDFEVSELAAKAAPFVAETVADARERSEELSAEDWFELGWELEATSPLDAMEAYEKAVALDPAHADAELNLGRLLHDEGRLEEAAGRYRRSEALRPDDPTAPFNLGVALQDMGRHADAANAYRRAVEIDPSLADAWYNLAGLCEELGEREEAFGCWKRYRELVRGG